MARIKVLDLLFPQDQLNELSAEEQKAVAGEGPAGCVAGGLGAALATSIYGVFTVTPPLENIRNIGAAAIGGCVVGAFAPTP